jgi:hypothetical protein
MILAQANSDGWECVVAAVVLGLTGVSVAWKMLRADARRVRQWQVNRDARDTRRRGFDPILKPPDPPKDPPI